MLLAQSFDPFDNIDKLQQKGKLPFLARCRFISQRTKRVLCNLRNRARHPTTRGFPTMVLPDNRFLLTPPQPEPWYFCPFYYDPYLMLGPPSHPMAFPQPPLSPPLPPMPQQQQQSMPYSICVHLTSSCPYEGCINQPHYYNNRKTARQDNSSINESTLYSSTSSIFNDDEKEQIEYDQGEDQLDDYTPRRARRTSRSNVAAAPPTLLTRSNSDILHDRQQQQHRERRPYLQHRWSSYNDMYY